MTDSEDQTTHSTIDVALALAGAVCEVTSSRIESYEDRRVSIKLTEAGLEDYIRELRLQEWDDEAREWLDGHRDENTTTEQSGGQS